MKEKSYGPNSHTFHTKSEIYLCYMYDSLKNRTCYDEDSRYSPKCKSQPNLKKLMMIMMKNSATCATRNQKADKN